MTNMIVRGAALGLAAAGAAVSIAGGQTPDEPTGYEAEEVVVDDPMSEDVRLACTLTTTPLRLRRRRLRAEGPLAWLSDIRLLLECRRSN